MSLVSLSIYLYLNLDLYLDLYIYTFFILISAPFWLLARAWWRYQQKIWTFSETTGIIRTMVEGNAFSRLQSLQLLEVRLQYQFGHEMLQSGAGGAAAGCTLPGLSLWITGGVWTPLPRALSRKSAHRPWCGVHPQDKSKHKQTCKGSFSIWACLACIESNRLRHWALIIMALHIWTEKDGDSLVLDTWSATSEAPLRQPIFLAGHAEQNDHGSIIYFPSR